MSTSVSMPLCIIKILSLFVPLKYSFILLTLIVILFVILVVCKFKYTEFQKSQIASIGLIF